MHTGANNRQDPACPLSVYLACITCLCSHLENTRILSVWRWKRTFLCFMLANPYARRDGNLLVDYSHAFQHFLRILYIFVINFSLSVLYIYFLTVYFFSSWSLILKVSSLLHKNGNVYTGMTVRLLGWVFIIHPLFCSTHYF